MLTAILLTLLASPTAPPATPSRIVKPASEEVATVYAERMAQLIEQIPDTYIRKVEKTDLVRAAIEGLFSASRQSVPPAILRTLSDDNTSNQAKLKQARILAGRVPELDGVRAFILSANAMSTVLDSGCSLTLYHNGAFSMSETELVGGIELDGIVHLDWLVYRVETGSRSNWTEPPPIPLPWRVKRVTPGLAAAKADIQPNDEIVSIDGICVKTDTAARLLPPLLIPIRGQNDANIGTALGKTMRVELLRGSKKLTVDMSVPEIQHEELHRESVFGYSRHKDGTWDFLTNSTDSIAYLRLSVFDEDTPESLARALNRIADEKPRGLLLDLRWTPGGLLHSGGRATSLFFRPEQPLAKLVWRNPARYGETLPRMPEGTVDELWMKLPMAVLVNSETYGGGETIAAAMQDNKRAVIIGQRTPGRGLIVGTLTPSITGLRYRITTGRSDRPSGKNRHKHDSSGPLDDWGVRPDVGFEIPTTPDLSKQLREWHEEKTIRPSGQAVAIAMDDPHADSQREKAIRLLKEKVIPAKK